MSTPWWRGAVFYEVYVRSFADSNDDGIGDLPGITSRLDYLKRLGADAVWLTPFYPSPQKDHGYDVSDYYDVNPEYGTLDDFDRLMEQAHALRLKVLVDLVPNHTSDQHPWFQAALSSPDDPHRALYHFAQGKEDGSPPNNWRSAFGGPAWSRDERSGQWYLHLFAPEQPDLNWWNPEVPAEFERIVRFWLDRGVDGYRIDVASALFKRKDLADMPMVADPRTGAIRPDPAFVIVDQPQVHEVYRRWRQILNEYQPDRVLVGEIFEPQRQSRYILPDQLNMAFALIRARWDANLWRRSIDIDMNALRGPGVAPSWTLSNHDVVRHVTRLGGGSIGRARARAALLLVLGLPGQVFLYQGEELGLEEVDLPAEERQDPVFIHSEGRQPGRDGCRVPMPWDRAKPHAGFSGSPPWLPEPAGWDRFAVSAEEASAGSMLSFYKTALALRRRSSRLLPPLVRWLAAPDGVLAFERGRLRVACNFLNRQVTLPACGRLLIATAPLAALKQGRLTLPPNSAAWLDTVLGA
ncbi:MAG TPA: alpha-amylase family glycosyl hydrolase [Candidatus Dormibacteraeota bacterium]|nr:alpha-amylase family glycosyl hydrolase [Candidatus Dormibacteraeota bacterium]